MLQAILVGIAIIVVAFVVIVSLQPADFLVTRKISIAAPPSEPFSLVNDFHNWDAWSPWAKRDPAMQTIYEGPASGEGAVYSWRGNREVGEGRMTIVESRPSERVRIRLEFLKPFQATNQAEFEFKPEGGQTTVTWTMTGRRNFMFKAFGLFMSMDKMVGGDFEKGLAQMKTAAEAGARHAV